MDAKINHEEHLTESELRRLEQEQYDLHIKDAAVTHDVLDMTLEEMRTHIGDDEYYEGQSIYLRANSDQLEKHEREDYWDHIFRRKKSPTSHIEFNESLTDRPLIYEGTAIDIKALSELLSSQGLSDSKVNYICRLIRAKIPTTSQNILTSETKKKLKKTEVKIRSLIANLKELADVDKSLIPHVESLRNYVDPIDFLYEVKTQLNDTLNQHFPKGKAKPDHIAFSHSIGQIWKVNVGGPTIHLESPFIKFLSICTNSTQEATMKRVGRKRMSSRIKAYAPF